MVRLVQSPVVTLRFTPSTLVCSNAMRSGWTGNSLLSALSLAAAYGICTAASTARGNKVKLKVKLLITVPVTIRFKVVLAGQVKADADKMQGAAE